MSKSIFDAIESIVGEHVPFKGKLIDDNMSEEEAAVYNGAYMNALNSLKNSDKNLKGDHLEKLGIKFGDTDLGWFAPGEEKKMTEYTLAENLNKDINYSDYLVKNFDDCGGKFKLSDYE